MVFISFNTFDYLVEYLTPLACVTFITLFTTGETSLCSHLNNSMNREYKSVKYLINELNLKVFINSCCSGEE